MLPFIGPEILEWLLCRGAQAEDSFIKEDPIAEPNQDSSIDKTVSSQKPRQKGRGRPLKWKEY
jgi:hypothetical protein